MNYQKADLEMWQEKIQAKAKEHGLNFYPQDFEICDHEEMLDCMTYSGMPSHYPHWSYGKARERLKTLYDYGITGLPYEMVINSNPALAYLMRDNTLLLQILTMAHVYGHNDFFKNNFLFGFTRPALTVETFKVHADRVRRYVEDPSIGLEKVEKVLDAAHALAHQCRRELAIKKLTPDEQEKNIADELQKRPDEYELRGLHKRREVDEAALEGIRKKNPKEPEEDILLFLSEPKNNPFMEDWARDLLRIVHEEARYFIPQIETKIMNEGWASFWHKRILETLDLPQGMHLEFLVKHNQVVSPMLGGINPYHLGIEVWKDIERRYDEAYAGKISEEDRWQYDRAGGAAGDLGKKPGTKKVFEVREEAKDASFLDRFLTENLVRELKLFEHEVKGEERLVSKVADKDNWKSIKRTLLGNTGMNTVPRIMIEDADHEGNRALFLRHYHDGERDLHIEYTERTLLHLQFLWGHVVVLETVMGGKKTILTVEDQSGQVSIKNVYS